MLSGFRDLNQFICLRWDECYYTEIYSLIIAYICCFPGVSCFILTLSWCCSSGSHCPAPPLFLQEAFGASCPNPHPTTERLRSRQIQEGLGVNGANPAKGHHLSCDWMRHQTFLLFFQGVFQRTGISPFIEQLHRGLVFSSPSLLDSA